MAVTPGMLAVALGQAAPEPGSVTEQQWQMWIDDADMLIDDRVVQTAGVDPDLAKRDYVIREAVVAHIKKPDDATQVTISVDDASSSRTYRSGKGRVSILDEWWTLLGLTDSSSAYSVDTVSTVGARHLPWCSLYFRGPICSCGVSLVGSAIYENDGL